MGKIGLIIQREYLTRVKKKSFIIMTLLGPILIAGAMALVFYIASQENQKQQVLIYDQTGIMFSDLKGGENYAFNYMDGMPSKSEAFEEFKTNETYTSFLVFEGDILSTDRMMLYFKVQPSFRVQRSIEEKVERRVEEIRLEGFDIDPKDYRKVREDFKVVAYKFTESGNTEKVGQQKVIIGFIFGIMIYMFIFIYGVQVMRGVIEEKTSRIVEVIITSVKPFQLMMGKIIGVALVGLTQFVLWIVLSSAFIGTIQGVMYDEKLKDLAKSDMKVTKQTRMNPQGTINAYKNENVEFLDITHPNNWYNTTPWGLVLGSFIFYFLGGYLLYSALFAAIGAAVDQETDTQQFMIPVTVPLIFAYTLSIAIMENPEGSAAMWGSIVPFTSPIIMMVRLMIGIESADMWQYFLSVFLLIGTFIGTVWLAGKIYRTGILMYGKKVSYKELWKWIRYKN